MNANILLQQVSDAMMLVMFLSLPPILVAAIVGIVVSFLQAITQIQEQTLSFAIKLIAVGFALALMAGTLGAEIFNYATKLFVSFPYLT